MLPGKQLHKIFEGRAREGPRRIAVCDSGMRLTYEELDRLAERVACELRRLGAGPGMLAGLCLERGAGMIAGLLGILKAGAAYVPMDPAYPAKRIQFLCADSGVEVIVTESALAAGLGGYNVRLLCMDDLPAAPSEREPAQPANSDEGNAAAYVIYTSGSTGTPKGVLVEHRNVIRLFEQTEPWFHFNHDDVWTMFHSISFDFSVWEIWGALLFGGRLVIVPSGIARSPAQFHCLLTEEKVTVLNQTPSAFRTLAAADSVQAAPAKFALRFIIFGGEALDVKLLIPWIERYGDQTPRLINMYGITETTVHVTYKRILREDLQRSDLRPLSPIGVPIPDLQLQLLDPDGKPVPDGTPGEIHVSGAGLARGYLHRPELTAERFAEGPPRLYRSGDRGVRLSNGEYAYLGRVDDQMKVRGFRIEPGEVETCLCGHREVAGAIVAAHDYGDGDVRLTAYVIPAAGLERGHSEEEKLMAELSAKAAEELPLHMRPSAYLIVDQIPLTAHGKADREALKELALRSHSLRDDGSAGLAETTEQAVIRIWKEILQRPDIGPRDEFFDLGGTSLALIRIFAQVNRQFGVSLNGSVLVEEPTAARLAQCINEALGRHSPATRELTATEQVVVGIWEDILQRRGIGVRDDFFDMGGTSLALIRIFARVNRHFEVSLNGSVLVDDPTAAQLARCVDSELKGRLAHETVLEKK